MALTDLFPHEMDLLFESLQRFFSMGVVCATIDVVIKNRHHTQAPIA
jgi:hypothetical protein